MIKLIKLARPPLIVLSIVAPAALMWHYLHTINVSLLIAIVTGNAALTILNDIMDYETDKIIKPYKPLVRGDVSFQEARRAVLVLSIVSIFSLLSTGSAELILLGEVAFFCGLIYNAIRKDFTGNVALAACYGLTAYMCSFNLRFAVAFALLTFSYNISVQIQDMLGDIHAEKYTLPIVHGIERAKPLMYATAVFSIFLFKNPLFMLSAVFVIASDLTDEREVFCRVLSRLFMILGFIVMFWW